MADKIRRIDFSPSEWLEGTVELSAVDRGVYITICALIWARGKRPTVDIIKAHCREHGNAVLASLDRLEKAGKILGNGLEIVQKRAENELEKAQIRSRKRLENLSEANKTKALGSAAASSATRVRGRADVHQPSTIKEESLERVSATLSESESAQDGASAEVLSGSKYAFSGKLVRVNWRDFRAWEQAYSAIPDLRAKLASLDDFYDRELNGNERKKWFVRCSAALGKEHQKALSEQRRSTELAPNEGLF